MLTIGVDASRTCAAQRTGTEQYSTALLRALMDLETPHHWRLYAPCPPPDDLLPLPPRWEWRALPFPRLWTHIRLSGEILRHRPDILFVPAHVVPLAHPRRTAVTLHDLGYLHIPESHTGASRRYLNWSTRWSARAARKIIAVSGATKADLVRTLHVPSAKIAVVLHGVRPDLRRPPETVIAAALGRLAIPRPYILFLGTVQPRKNLQRLIRAFGRVVAAGLPHTLVIAGRLGWLTGAIQAEVDAQGLGARVHFPGYIADADVPSLYAGADTFAFPSLYEGFGMPALEAMACGVPLVAANTTSLPEIVGDAGLLVDPLDEGAIADALIAVLRDDMLRARLVAAGTQRVAQFSWERCARETLAVLEAMGEGR
jgi:glycosyltransferase involved in cell wall biosynthesis